MKTSLHGKGKNKYKEMEKRKGNCRNSLGGTICDSKRFKGVGGGSKIKEILQENAPELIERVH